MTTFTEMIAALPPMPQPLLNPNYPGEPVRQFREQYWVDVARAALARLALAREWIIERGHDRDCSVRTTTEGSCDCDSGRLLAALEGPK